MNISIKYTFALINSSGQEENIQGGSIDIKKKIVGVGYTNFIKRDLLFCKADSLIRNDTLTIMCKVFENPEIIL